MPANDFTAADVKAALETEREMHDLTVQSIEATGACTIDVPNISPTCLAGLTESSCKAVAAKFPGATAHWVSGGKCPG